MASGGRTTSKFPQGEVILFSAIERNAKAVTPDSSHDNFIDNDIVFSQAMLNPTIQGGTFQVHRQASEVTIDTSELHEDSQYLMAII
jgi:hypothetical protein